MMGSACWARCPWRYWDWDVVFFRTIENSVARPGASSMFVSPMTDEWVLVDSAGSVGISGAAVSLSPPLRLSSAIGEPAVASEWSEEMGDS
jgi:hypothetical protein